MSEIPKTYDPRSWENEISKRWEESGYANPDTCVRDGIAEPSAATFSIMLPPPNATGHLHVGHAAMLAIEDTLIRYHRMKGDRTLWLPGTDHAAIATQEKVERILFKEEGKTRHDLGREKFLDRVHDFVEKSRNVIKSQVRAMGSSVDWSREAFTLDKARNEAVNTAFARMHADGIIYRGDRIVNWDPKLQTTVSDDEMERLTETAPFYYLKYGPFVIGTSRPETKFGDKYVVVHPDDERYASYRHGQEVPVEWIHGTVTATVIKDTAIDMTFGTGAMTITPWHDPIDFEIAQRHGLEKTQIIGYDGKLLAIAGKGFVGLDIFECRKKLVEKLTEKGLVASTEENYTHNVAVNSRGGGFIEPQIMRQWFVDVNRPFERDGTKTTLKTLMLEAVRSGSVDIIPKRFEKTYFHWIENLRDWCISRQIWYGHRIPVWYCLSCGKEKVSHAVKSRWFFIRHAESEHNAQEITSGTTDVSLNDTGREQARRAAQRLAGENIEAIFSSPLTRARETAEILAKGIGIDEIITDERLRERHMGEAEGLSYSETEKKYTDFRHYTGKSANNESFQEAEERVWECVSDHLKKHSHRNVLIVSHGGALRALWRKVRNIDPERIMTDIDRFQNAEPLSVDVLDPCDGCGQHFFEQDPDTLDTWFSSGLWTFSTLGWPRDEADGKNDLSDYHPTTVLETGYDILFFWVARMILMSTYLLGEVPFKTVYLHGLVRDDQGRKMSKSLGNSIDPIDVIGEFGTDAVRLALLIGSTPGNDLRLSEDKISSFRNFANKLWNIGRYVYGNSENVPLDGSVALSDADRWILARLSQTISRVTDGLESFQISLAGESLRDFTWNEFADWYVEAHKIEKNDAVLRHVFGKILRLWHPFMPFVTEALFRTGGTQDRSLLMVEPWPESVPAAEGNGADFENVIGLVKHIRTLRNMYRIPPHTLLDISIACPEKEMPVVFGPTFVKLARVGAIVRSGDGDRTDDCATIVTGQNKAFVRIGDVIDIASEKRRLTEELSTLRKHAENTQKRLSGTAYLEKAPPKIVEQSREQLRSLQEKIAQTEELINQLSS